ncbi:DeoR/GlpR family DNA-binding transcription regulator [Kaistia sp. 32K]|uniref:DeoR/GlpR family DNA-binding transcription regulator n=1 Tax=Kaistia sp. 32K TaxID=2795690 RepID=UPI001FD4E946|nr:DeoR/GlpR family DNA-binding transcription regulator [Kaistia sp. 32K]
MFTDERHERIRQELAENGRVLAAELAGQFGVSEDTIRRDLREMAKAGLCRRVYGGALAVSPAPDGGPLGERLLAGRDSKARLGHVAAGLVKEAQTIFIDAGSTNVAIARALPLDRKFTVITNSPAIAVALAGHGNCTTILLGGVFNPDKGACLGAQTLREVQQVYADLLILGSCGLSPLVGVTALDWDEAQIKRAMVQQSRDVLLAATNDKLDTVAPFRICEINDIGQLILEGDASPATIRALREMGPTVHQADEGAD